MPVVRPYGPADLPRLVELSEVLGYPLEAEELFERVGLLDDDDLLVVGEVDAVVVGFASARLDDHVAEGPAVEVVALVVDPAAQRRGVAAALMGAVEAWARDCGRGVLRLRSNVVREAAHRFYTGEGFEVVKRSTVFEKRLDPDAPQDRHDADSQSAP
jgi:GNAT superfamily N-acetyltransferase